ncbi:MAG: hypothetical protein AAFU55_07685 [Pseudomonadota bacterium]
MAQALDLAIGEGRKDLAAEAHLFLAALRLTRRNRQEALWHAQSAVRLFGDVGDVAQMHRAIRFARTAVAVARAG